MAVADTSGHPAARRTVLAGAGLAAGATLATGLEGTAYAAARHAGAPAAVDPGPPPRRPLLLRRDPGARQAGAGPRRRARSGSSGSSRPAGCKDPAGDALALVVPPPEVVAVARSPTENDSGRVGGWEVMADYQNSLLLRRMMSQRQVLETMAEFWENHFNVPVSADGVYTWRVRYGNAIRARALDSFESLLQAVSVHPAMGMYLGNAVSDKEHPNENQGRELLELHTVGLGAGYSEAMVVDSARILTGWRVDMWDTWAAFYDAGSHYTKPVRVLGFRSKNHSTDGRQVTRDYLRYLAHHPATAPAHRRQARHRVRLATTRRRRW